MKKSTSELQYKGALISPTALSPFRTTSILSMDWIALSQEDVNIMLGKLNGAIEAELIQGNAIFLRMTLLIEDL